MIVNTIEFYHAVVPPWATRALASSSATDLRINGEILRIFHLGNSGILTHWSSVEQRVKDAVSEELVHVDKQQMVERQCVLARYEDGHWYAIPLGLEYALRKAGAEVRLIPTERMAEDAP